LTAYQEPEVIKALTLAGYDLVTSTPQELGVFNKEQIDVWRRASALGKIEPR
jgi:hypothetical protein